MDVYDLHEWPVDIMYQLLFLRRYITRDNNYLQ